MAREWLCEPLNANGRPNSDVLKPWVNGLDFTRRPRDMWIIDFGWAISEREAALYQAPFAFILEKVKPDATAIGAQLTAITGGGMSSRVPRCGPRWKSLTATLACLDLTWSRWRTFMLHRNADRREASRICPH